MSKIPCNFAKQLSAMMDIRVAISFPKGFLSWTKVWKLFCCAGARTILLYLRHESQEKEDQEEGYLRR